jgi:hypothetical protein
MIGRGHDWRKAFYALTHRPLALIVPMSLTHHETHQT